MSNKIRAAVVGYGNIGKAAVEALRANEDFTLCGVVRRNPDAPQPAELSDVPVVGEIDALGEVDIALICAPTRSVPEMASALLQKGIRTVDSYDIHTAAVRVKIDLPLCVKRRDDGHARAFKDSCHRWFPPHALYGMYPWETSSSAVSTAPPAAPRNVLCERQTNL